MRRCLNCRELAPTCLCFYCLRAMAITALVTAIVSGVVGRLFP